MAAAHMMVAAAGMVMAVAGGCSDDLAVVPPPPIDIGIRTLVLAIDTETDFEVRVIAVTDGVPSADAFPIRLRTPIEAGTRVTLEALAYVEAPEALGLTPGVVASSTEARARTLRDAPSLRRLELEVPEDDDAAWVQATEPSTKLASFRVAGPPTTCTDFEAVQGILGSAMNWPQFATEVEPGVVLVGTEVESFFAVQREEIARVETSLVQGYRALAVAGPDALWFGGDFGVLSRGRFRPQLRIDETLYTRSGGQIRWVAAGPVENGRDVFTLSREGVLEHHDEAGSRIVHDFGTEAGGNHPGALVWLGPREVMVAWSTANRGILHVKYIGDDWQVELEETDATAAFTAGTFNPALGQVVGNSDGQFYVRRARGWEELTGSELRVWPFEMVPYGDGFLYGTAFGNFGQYTQTDGFCPLQQVFAGDIRQLAVVGRDVLITGPSSSRQAPYVWMRAR